MENLNSSSSANYNNGVEIRDMLNTGWGIFRKNIFGFVIYCIVTIILLTISIYTIVGIFIVALPLIMGNYRMADKIYREESRFFGNFFGGFRSVFSFLILTVLFVALVAGLLYFALFAFANQFDQSQIDWQNPVVMVVQLLGEAFSLFAVVAVLLIPVTYTIIAFSFAPILILLDGFSFWQAMKKSWKMFHQHWFVMMIAFVLLGFIVLLGSIPAGLGLFITLPLSWCMHYALYRQLMPVPEGMKESPQS